MLGQVRSGKHRRGQIRPLFLGYNSLGLVSRV
jgi:hypothetical protein